jgi:hypothetical protein
MALLIKVCVNVNVDIESKTLANAGPNQSEHKPHLAAEL